MDVKGRWGGVGEGQTPAIGYGNGVFGIWHLGSTHLTHVHGSADSLIMNMLNRLMARPQGRRRALL